MTSEQQVKAKFPNAKCLTLSIHDRVEHVKCLIYTYIDGEKFYLGVGHSAYTAWSSAMRNLGMNIRKYRKYVNQ